MWFYLAIASAAGWAIGSILLKRSYQSFSPGQIYLLNGISFLSLWLIYNWANQVAFALPNQKLFFFLPALPALAFITFIQALKQGRVSIISAIIAISPLISTTLAVFLLREKINSLQLSLIILIVIAIIAIQLENHQNNDLRTKTDIVKELVWGLSTAFAFALANTANKIVINQIGPANFSLINAHWMLITGFTWLIFEKRLFQWRFFLTKKGLKLSLGSLIYSLGGVFLFLALEIAPISLVIPITNLSVPLTLILASIFLQEKTTKIQKASILAIFLATTILKRIS